MERRWVQAEESKLCHTSCEVFLRIFPFMMHRDVNCCTGHGGVMFVEIGFFYRNLAVNLCNGIMHAAVPFYNAIF